MQTNFNFVIGGYNPDRWEDTTGKKNYFGMTNYKDIVTGKPFLFYWVDDQIEIIKHKNDRIPYMRSDKFALLEFGYGLFIRADKDKASNAYFFLKEWVLP